MSAPDPAAFEEECLQAFEASQVARGFSDVTIDNGGGTLRRFLAACGRPAWEVTREPGFTGTILDAADQRRLFGRWASQASHPHERLAGLLALLHAASIAEIRDLTIGDINLSRRTLALTGRPFPVPVDPATWAAVEACLAHRDQLATLNPHVIVTRVTRTGDKPADGSYLTRQLAAAGTTPSACRQTRIAQLVNDLDPSGLVRYLSDNVARDRLERLARR